LFYFILVIVLCAPGTWLFCVVVNLVICISLGLLYISVVVFLVLILFFSLLVQRLAWKSISEMTYFVSSGM